MKLLFFQTLYLLMFHYGAAQEAFRLAKPIIGYRSAFFNDSAVADLRFAQAGTQIYYTLNGREPTEADSKYQRPVVIKESMTTLKAKVFGRGFFPSATASVTFIQDGLPIKSVEQPAGDENFKGNGAATLQDNLGGIADMHSTNFIGYRRDSVTILITLDKPQSVQSILFDFLQDEGSWIFLPQKVEVLFYNYKNRAYDPWLEKIFSPDSLIKGSSTVLAMLTSGQKLVTDQIKVMLRPLSSIPAWHPGKGNKAWLFIDEVKIY